MSVATGELQVENKARGKLMLLSLCVGVFLVNLDITATNLALPAIHNQLGGALTDLQWVIDVYVLAMACLLLSAGALADRVGRKRALLIGLAGFAIASIICASAATISELIIGRCLQGLSAALLVPTALAMMSILWPGPTDRAKAIGTGAAVGGLALAAGPILAGGLVQFLGWRSLFLVNVPIVMVCGAIILALAPNESSSAPRRPLNLWGQALLAIAISGLAYMLIEWPRHAQLSLESAAPLLLSAASAIAFALTESRSRQRLIPAELLRNRVLALCCAVSFVMYMAAFCVFFLMTIRFQSLEGLPAAEAGIRFLFLTVTVAAFSYAATYLANKTSPRLMMSIGALLVSLGVFGLAIMPIQAPLWFILLGLGFSSVTAPASMATLAAAPSEFAATAAGLLNTCRQLGALVGVAFAGTVLIARARIVVAHAPLSPVLDSARDALAMQVAVGRLGGSVGVSSATLAHLFDISSATVFGIAAAAGLAMAVCVALGLKIDGPDI